MKPGIRIIGGQFRGKKIPVPDRAGLRPTPDRVRETLFNWLMPCIRGARCLDAFSGSGALGLEALSRGAEHVVLLEKDPETFAGLQAIARSLPCPGAEIILADALHWLRHCKASFDIIFLDPPFQSGLVPECLSVIAENALLKAGGFVYTETAAPGIPLSRDWHIHRQKRAGDVVFSLLETAGQASFT